MKKRVSKTKRAVIGATLLGVMGAGIGHIRDSNERTAIAERVSTLTRQYEQTSKRKASKRDLGIIQADLAKARKDLDEKKPIGTLLGGMVGMSLGAAGGALTKRKDKKSETPNRAEATTEEVPLEGQFSRKQVELQRGYTPGQLNVLWTLFNKAGVRSYVEHPHFNQPLGERQLSEANGVHLPVHLQENDLGRLFEERIISYNNLKELNRPESSSLLTGVITLTDWGKGIANNLFYTQKKRKAD